MRYSITMKCAGGSSHLTFSGLGIDVSFIVRPLYFIGEAAGTDASVQIILYGNDVAMMAYSAPTLLSGNLPRSVSVRVPPQTDFHRPAPTDRILTVYLLPDNAATIRLTGQLVLQYRTISLLLQPSMVRDEEWLQQASPSRRDEVASASSVGSSALLACFRKVACGEVPDVGTPSVSK